MEIDNENESLLLEMRAKCVLNDISNQEDRRTKLNWISKINSQRKSSTKLPSLSLDRKSTKLQLRQKPWLMRQKGNFYRQKMDQLLNDVQNSDRFPEFSIIKKLDKAIPLQNKENLQISSLLIKKRRSNRYTTQNDCQNYQNEYNYETSLLLKSKGFENESKFKKNWSVHVRKALVTLGRQKESMNREIESIKSMIEDKRNKCRMLSKQGYLIVKQEPIQQESKDFHCSAENIREKHKSLDKHSHRQKTVLKASIQNISSSGGVFRDALKCKSFLNNAYEILALRQSENHL